tara:strand:- start:129 stop:779 length:651 start_codon:yes stop_codon:yes gene_type:complete
MISYVDCLNGLHLGFGTLTLTILLEITNLSTVKKIINHQGKSVYITACINTTVNSLIYGPLVYNYIKDDSKIHKFSLININNILIIHSIGYWCAHKLMHTKYLYFIHKFHHTFSIYVTPVIAMAVSIYEYFFAYMTPFVIGSYIIKPSNIELITAASIVSVCNLIIHNPNLEYLGTYYPDWLVSPEKHLKHHSLKNKHIAASTYDIDFFFNKCIVI